MHGSLCKLSFRLILSLLLFLYFYFSTSTPLCPQSPKHGDGEEKRDRERNRDRMREKKREFTITTVPCEEMVKLGLWLNRAMDKNYFLFCSLFGKSPNLSLEKFCFLYAIHIISE